MKFAHCKRIVFVTGKYTALFFWGGGGGHSGWISIGESLFGRDISGGNSPGKRYTGGISQNCYTKFFLIVLYSLYQIFHVQMLRGELSRGYFTRVLISRE